MMSKQHRGGKKLGNTRQRKIKVGNEYVAIGTGGVALDAREDMLLDNCGGEYMGFFLYRETGYKRGCVVPQIYAYRKKDKSIPKNIKLGPFTKFEEMETRVRAFMKQYNQFVARWQRGTEPYHKAVVKFLQRYKNVTAELEFV
jgi:hypothetical protein